MEVTRNCSYNESLCLKMKTLITEINTYLTTRTEDCALLINKHLQAFSVTIDINIFDPDTNLGAKFFVSLYQLFNKIEPQSQMAWYCVDVLTNVCRNSSARRALINTYSFMPCLSRLLGDQLTGVKKKKLLKLMQDLSCGIKISWQIPHLPHLLQTLTKWVESQDEEIVSLSLGVLVNLCYKNLPAVYSLSKSVDIKKFLRFCLPLRGPIIEIHVCKLMVILDYMHIDIPKHTLIKFVEPTFLSIFEAFKNNDPILLRQIVDFFLDVITQSKDRHILKEYQQYGEQIDNLLQLVENNITHNSADSESSSKDNNNPECISLVLEFIYSLMLHDIESLTNLHPKVNKLAIDWVHSDWVSFQALTILTKIVEKTLDSDGEKNRREILEALVAALPALLLILQSNTTPSNMEGCRRLGALLQLFRAMLLVSSIRPKVLQMLEEETVEKIFTPLQSDSLCVDCLPNLKSDNANMASTDAVNTYLYGLGLINELAQHDASWRGLQTTLLENRKIHMIIAQALYGGTSEVRSVALEICRHVSLPIKKVASAMDILQPLFAEVTESSSKGRHSIHDIGFPTLSFAQMERLDDTLERLKRLMDESNTSNIATSQVMELYEYKLATLGYAEKSALDSIEAATERCTQLQHRLAQITAEQNKLQQLLFHTEHCLEQTTKSKEEIKEMYVQEQNRALAAIGRIKVCEGQLKNKEKALTECEEQIRENNKQIKDMSETILKLKEQVAKKEQVINKLVESGNKSEKNLQKSEDLLRKANLDNKNLNMQVSKLEEELKLKEMKLMESREQYQATKAIIDTITKVATSQIPTSTT